MSQATSAFLKGQYGIKQAMAPDAAASDATLVIDGYENFYIKAKSFPDPNSGIPANIEVPMPLGNKSYKVSQAQTAFTGSATFIETEKGDVQNMFDEIKFNTGGYFDAWIYTGTPDKYVMRKRIIGCFFEQASPATRDMQSNTELLQLEGELTGNYFSEIELGNVDTLEGGF